MIFAAAYNPKGTPAQLIQCSEEKSWELITSVYAWHEVESNLKKKAPLYLERMASIKPQIKVLKGPDSWSSDIPLKMKDVPIYRAALFHRCEYLITGDNRDFSPLIGQNYKLLTRILSPKQMMQLGTKHKKAPHD